MTLPNVASFFYMSQQVIPQMKKQNSGQCGEHAAAWRDINRAAPCPALLAGGVEKRRLRR